GHVDIIDRALPLFDTLYIGVGINSNKQPMFDLNKRLGWIDKVYHNNPKVKSISYEGLTAKFCEEIGAKFILRGIRYVSDFEYEKSIADVNRMLDHDLETVFLTCSPQYSSFSSTLVRDVLKNGGDVSQFLPKGMDLG
ncbi:MAG: pantetheine-phosphate adenylyltransferase, partial [Bacteroidota bacterium]